MARALPLSHPPTLSRLRQRLPQSRESGNQVQEQLRRYAAPAPMYDTYANAGEEKSSTLFAP